MKLKRFYARFSGGRIYEFRCLDMTGAVAKAEAFAKAEGLVVLVVSQRGYS